MPLDLSIRGGSAGGRGKFMWLGYFLTVEEAEAAYRSKARELRGAYAPAEYEANGDGCPDGWTMEGAVDAGKSDV